MKWTKGSKILCIVGAVALCILFTGSSLRGITARFNDNILNCSNIVETMDDSARKRGTSFNLDELVQEGNGIQMSYDLVSPVEGRTEKIVAFTGDRNLLGEKAAGLSLRLEGDGGSSWPLELNFDVYRWIDEGKQMGVLNLFLSEESVRSIIQMTDTMLYDDIPKGELYKLDAETHEGVKKVLFTRRYILKAEEGGEWTDMKPLEDIWIFTRSLQIIMPEKSE